MSIRLATRNLHNFAGIKQLLNSKFNELGIISEQTSQDDSRKKQVFGNFLAVESESRYFIKPKLGAQVIPLVAVRFL